MQWVTIFLFFEKEGLLTSHCIARLLDKDLNEHFFNIDQTDVLKAGANYERVSLDVETWKWHKAKFVDIVFRVSHNSLYWAPILYN